MIKIIEIKTPLKVLTFQKHWCEICRKYTSASIEEDESIRCLNYGDKDEKCHFTENKIKNF